MSPSQGYPWFVSLNINSTMGKSAPGAFSLIKGKVGGVVFYKVTDSNNKSTQGQRIYTADVRNPNTAKQQFQRAFLKTVSQMYAQGKVIFDHSFQGKSKGGQCAREFRKLNVRALRAQAISDIDRGLRPTEFNSFICAKGSNSAVPNEYIISRGTYDQNFFGWNQTNKVFKTPDATENQTVAAYAAANGLISGDIYTFVALIVDNTVVAGGDGLTPYETNYKSNFLYSRFRVKAELSGTDEITNMSQVFEQLPSSLPNVDQTSLQPGDDWMMPDIFALDVPLLGAIGLIRSREDADLRSDSTMHLLPQTGIGAPGFGIISAFAGKYWGNDIPGVGESSKLLEGGDGNF